jgi:hypothetical protein
MCREAETAGKKARSVVLSATAVCVLTWALIASVALHNDPRAGGFDSAFRNWCTARDGQRYVSIVQDGYSSDPGRQSLVAFFPLLPLAAGGIRWLTCLSAETSVCLAANLFLLGAFVLLGWYLRIRHPGARESVLRYSLLAFAVFPTSFFFRACYSESSFLFFAILSMLAMEQR